MTQENKELLLKDLCARLPYGVKFKWCDGLHDDYYTLIGIDEQYIIGRSAGGHEVLFIIGEDDVKPYLRPMSSMTEEEREEYEKTLEIEYQDMLPEPIYHKTLDSYYYLLEHHFDFLGLIPAGFAIAVTEENNPYKD